MSIERLAPAEADPPVLEPGDAAEVAPGDTPTAAGDPAALREELSATVEGLWALRGMAEADPEELARLRGQADRSAWDLRLSLVREALAGESITDRPSFDAPASLALDYGLFALGVGDWEEDLLDAVRSGGRSDGADGETPAGALPVLLLTDVVDLAHREFLRAPAWRELARRRTDAERRVAACERMRETLRTSRDRLASWRLPARALAEVCEGYRGLDRVVETFIVYDRENATGGIASRERRLAYVRLKAEVAALRERLDRAWKRVEGAQRVQALEGRIERNVVDLLEARAALEKVDVEREALQAEIAALSPVDARRNLADTANHLRLLVRMCAQRARGRPVSLPLGPSTLTTPATVREAVDRLLAIDPDLCDNPLARRVGVPRVVICPGWGAGIYDFTRNALVVPTLCPRGVLESLASAVIMYRDDVDGQFNERRLINSYGSEVPDNKAVRSRKELRERLTRDYLVWATKEAAGYAILTKETRAWFERNIAPKKRDPIFPRALRGLTLVRAREELDRREAALRDLGAERAVELVDAGRMGRADAARLYYEAGVLRWCLDRLDGAEEAFAAATEVDPDFVDAWYSLGVTHKKLGVRSQQDFQEFLQRAPQSWWTSKARELASR
ncbi:MAG: hypothetical protein HY722_03145 [Planctomycetes bacterium]|nr:hypothetical protein [Planctomycetota bacterium]